MSYKIREAELAASKIIDKYGITVPSEIRIKDIAYDLGAIVVEGSMVGAAASLVVVNKSATIRINSKELYPHRKRFSIGHELGHFILKHGHSIQRICSDSDLLSYDSSEESQANAFSAELLLPEQLIKTRCEVGEVSFEIIKKIAEVFRVSLSATALRFVRFCPEPCAIVFSQNNKIKWFRKSESWWPFIPKPGSLLDGASCASLFFKGEFVPDEPIEVEGYAWADDKYPDHIIEHSIVSPQLGFVLSLLWLESAY